MTNIEESIKHLREVWFGASATGDEFERQALELLKPHLSNREVLERFVRFVNNYSGSKATLNYLINKFLESEAI